MYTLDVIDLDGSRAASTPGELADAIGRRLDRGNHFMIASADAKHPMLDVMVHDEYAVLHYFETEGVAGHQSVTNIADPPDAVAFPENLTGETVLMPGSVVIDVPTATRCVEQFAEDLARPTLISWLEL